MCGLVGVVGTTDDGEVDRMLQAVRHRGPDNYSIEVNQKNGMSYGLGHARLSIIDLSKSANQPMWNEAGDVVIVYNGEIYNFRELKSKYLPEVTFRTHSDTEVIFRLYEKYPTDFIEKLNGMFSFAILDIRKGKTILGRDRFGIKPLYYFLDSQGRLIFASEVKGILNADTLSKNINVQALVDYMHWGAVIAPDTLFEGVKSLLPGHTGIFEKGEFKTQRWAPTQTASVEKELTYSEARERIKQAFANSISRHFVSDVPVGIFLSGGLDSSIMLIQAHESGFQNLNTFSISYASSENVEDETKYSKLLAKRYGTSHHEVFINDIRVLDDLHLFLEAVDQPTHDGVNTYLISKYASQFTKVALSGLGGDELFGGYKYYRPLVSTQWFKQVIPFSSVLLKLANSLDESLNPAMGQLSKAVFLLANDFPSAYERLRMLFQEKVWKGLKSKAFPSSTSFTQIEDILQSRQTTAPLDSFEKISCYDFAYYLENVLLRDSDVFGMHFSLELRVPYLDVEFVDAVSRVPSKLKFQMFGDSKKIFKTSYQSKLPKEIYHKQKTGFTLPLGRWLKKEARVLVEETLSESKVQKRGIFDPEYVNNLKMCFLDGRIKEIHYPQVWALIVLEHYLQKHFGDVSISESLAAAA